MSTQLKTISHMVNLYYMHYRAFLFSLNGRSLFISILYINKPKYIKGIKTWITPMS